MSRVGGRFSGYSQENELQRSIREPVTCWRRERVVPSALTRQAGNVPSMTERIGPEGAATRSNTPLTIWKWMRTSEVMHGDAGHVQKAASAAEHAPAGEEVTNAADAASESCAALKRPDDTASPMDAGYNITPSDRTPSAATPSDPLAASVVSVHDASPSAAATSSETDTLPETAAVREDDRASPAPSGPDPAGASGDPATAPTL
ncbi:hypothetical protein MSPP1_003583 [Malassezia sp. CBS 17886]|nr:hypothetical protein MSPP1_003583 [Malassezia sp. CBS 17886]